MADYLADAIKIGIPSIVAITSMIANIYLARQNQKKDIQIEQGKLAHDLKRVAIDRKGGLVMEISKRLAQYNTAMMKYGAIRCAQLMTLAQDISLNEEQQKDVDDSYDEASKELGTCADIVASVYILGDKSLIENFQ